MATTPKVILDVLNDLLDEEFKNFKWQLLNGGLTDSSIPRGKLKEADRSDAVDLMVDQYNESDAGKIAVRALRNIKQNNRADQLETKLQKVQEDVPAGGGASSGGTGGGSSGGTGGTAQTTGVTMNINSSGGTVKAPVVHVQQPEQVEGRNAPVFEEENLLIQSDWMRPGRIIPCSQEFKDRILRENRDNVYIPKEMSQRKRSALLITNIEFEHLKYRAGAEEDEKNMEWLLKALGYSVEKHRNLSGKEINDKVEKFAAPPKHQHSDSTFVVIMSHGNIIQNKDAILGVHYHKDLNPNDFFFVDDIFSHLNLENCSALIDKPKVILIQACRGGHTGAVEIQSDAAVHVEKDFVSFKSSLPGIRAYRNRFDGSYFICYIVEVFCKWAHTDDIMELFRKVTSFMEKDPRFKNVKVDGGPAKLMPCIDRTSLPNKLYLFPGL